MSTIKANTLLHSDGSTTNPPAIPALDKRMAKAWWNFDGRSTPSFHDSYNCSSITDNGTGNYIINFTSNMSNTVYGIVTGIDEAVSTGAMVSVDSRAVGSCRVLTRNGSAALSDEAFINGTVFSN